MIIQIYKKETKEVVEEKTLTDRGFKAFLYYFSVQCDTKNYDWKIKKQEIKA